MPSKYNAKIFAVTKLSSKIGIVSMSVTSCIPKMGPKKLFFIFRIGHFKNVHFQNFL